MVISFTPISAPPPTHPNKENFERQQRELEQEQRQIAESMGVIGHNVDECKLFFFNFKIL